MECSFSCQQFDSQFSASSSEAEPYTEIFWGEAVADSGKKAAVNEIFRVKRRALFVEQY